MPIEIYAPIVAVALTLLTVVLAVRRHHRRDRTMAARTAPPTIWTPAATTAAAWHSAQNGTWTDSWNDVWGDAR
ncbi:hypothetical protein ACTVCO_05805 [Sanguibacter sp. A247]|uniref:hypothetical protein n=1 Tax=unclassified Sanguibacter TaxID=2645534 RepID=UPI003FD7B146